MRLVIAAIAAALLSPLTALAQAPPVTAYDYFVAPLGYQQLTSLGVATALTVPNDSSGRAARKAVIECDSVAAIGVRWRDDGTAPTATVGMELLPGASYVYTGNLAALQFIQVTASAKLNVTYYAQ